jgi:hypothetical protein
MARNTNGRHGVCRFGGLRAVPSANFHGTKNYAKGPRPVSSGEQRGVNRTSRPGFRSPSVQVPNLRTNGKSTYEVSDDKQKISGLLAWAFGGTHLGQSNLFERDGAWYVARSTYFPAINGIDFTPTRALESPLPRRWPGRLARKRCAVVSNVTLRQSPSSRSPSKKQFTKGVGCEACHGPGVNHVAAKRAEKMLQGEVSGAGGAEFIFNVSRLSPTELRGFLLSVPRNLVGRRVDRGERRSLAGVSLAATANAGEPAIQALPCIAYHDPHQQLEKRFERYDPKCPACLVNSKGQTVNAARPAKVATFPPFAPFQRDLLHLRRPRNSSSAPPRRRATLIWIAEK